MTNEDFRRLFALLSSVEGSVSYTGSEDRIDTLPNFLNWDFRRYLPPEQFDVSINLTGVSRSDCQFLFDLFPKLGKGL